MEVITKTNRFKEVLRKERALGHRIGFIPTMGALHEGHLSLVRRAAGVSDTVVVSIFVNPAQFGPSEDLDKYPRTLSHDVDLLTRLEVDYIFAPTPEEIYPREFESFIEVEGLSGKLCGASRPGHFRGVTTVVAKLFSITAPHAAFFGQKDAQQAIIIRKMVKDLNFPVDIRVCPIVREPDGLAMSSRNVYLKPGERAAATVLHRSLCRAATLVMEGVRDAGVVVGEMRRLIAAEPLARIDYVEIVDTAELEPVKTLKGEALAALAVYLGSTRLIDNILLSVQ